MMHLPLTLPELMRRAERMAADREIVSRRPDGRLHAYTYAELGRRSHALAQRLRATGIRPGERVGSLMWNHHGHLEAYFGVPAAGAVLHTINHRLSADDIVYIVNHAQDRLLLIDDVLLELYETIKPRIEVERVIVFPFSGRPLPAGYQDYEEWLAQPCPPQPLPAVDEEAPASLCYTGGSTGRPKGVCYSHRGLVMHAYGQTLTEGYGISGRDSVLAAVPMFHGNGWGLPFAAALSGAKLVLPGPRLDPESVLGLFEEQAVSFSAGVPTIWGEVARALDAEPARWRLAGSITVLTGGAAPPARLFPQLARHGIDLIQGWGMTETASVITVSRPRAAGAEGERQRLSQGRVMPIAELRVTREGRELPWDGDSAGDIEVRGACVAAEYFRRPELAERWTADGWLRTGDIGAIDAQGYLKVLERKEDLIKSGGEWILPQELEDALLAVDGIGECTVIGIPHPKWGERPLALLVLRDGAELSAEALRAQLLGRFAKWQLPDGFVQLPSIPRTSVGKIARRALRQAFAGWPDVAAEPDLPWRRLG